MLSVKPGWKLSPVFGVLGKMDRRHFINTLGVTGTLAAVGGLTGSLGAAPNSSGKEDGKPFLNGTPAVFAPTKNSITVVWTLNSPALVWVEYGETEQLGKVAGSDAYGYVPHDERVVKVRLQGLKPGTRYYWRSVAKPLRGSTETRSKIYTCKTLDDTASSVKFSVWNDTHDNAETIQKLHARVRGGADDFLLWNGDVSNNVNRIDMIPGLYVSPKGVDLAEGPPILMTRGNHDVRGIWSNKMSDYVDFPGNRPFYAFRVGPVAVIALDTGEDKPDSHPSFQGVAAFEPLIKEQAAWLEEVIRRPEMRDAPYRVVFCHIPLRWLKEEQPDYDKGGFDHVSLRGRAAWGDALMRWGMQVVISGHTHRRAWIPPNTEFPYGQLVGGGPRMDGATIIRGSADGTKLRLVVESAKDGSVLEDQSFLPLK
ncbi:MAG: metallophosphoesterase [Puniceicoccales bacterium]|jgi:predicted phosphodiesterase|nr:metallophosphoesterase [Puniceicoccales bacterium]